MASGGTLEQLSSAVGTALAALSDDLLPDRVSDLLVELGLDDTLDLSGDPLFQQTLADGIRACEQVFPKLEALSDAVAAGDMELSIRAGIDVRAAVAASVTALDAVAIDLKRAAATTPLAGSAASLSSELVQRLVGYALVCNLERTHPALLGVLEILTIVERTATHVGSGATARTVLRRRFQYDRIAQVINDPLAVLRNGYGWGTEALELDLLLGRVGRLLLAIDVLTGDVVDDDDNPTRALDLFGLTVGARTDRHPPGLAAALTSGAADPSVIPLFTPSPEWRLDLELKGAFREGLILLLLPPLTVEVAGVIAPAPGSARLRLHGEAADPSTSFVLLGLAGGSRVEAKQVDATVGGSFFSEGSSGAFAADIVGDLDVVGGGMVLSLRGADGFLSEVLPEDLRFNFDFGLTWSSDRGVSFRGATGLDATLPVSLSVGALTIPTVHLGLEASDAGLRADVSAGVGLSIGPVQALVDGVGMSTVVTFPREGGNLGAADLQLGFKAPSGVALVVDAAGVNGGGFLDRDPATGRYSGVLDLHWQKIGINALGLIDTEMPAGAGGYALLLALSATFPGVQVGFGFALTGVGGLLALNRRVDVDALRGRLAAGTAGRILAPQDPIRNAPSLLADLDAVFPVAPGVTIVGPTAQLVWADLVHVDLGLFVELPGPTRVVLLGSAHAEIARDGRTYLSIRVDIVGVVDLRAELAAFDAALVDSHLMGMLDLTGGAAFRLSWGAQPYAVLSLGGFHPSYNPAPLSFPASLTRIAMVHGKPSDEVYLRFEGYFAITSNTLQFGASVEAAINSGGWAIHGSLGFDALIQRVPFHFTFDIRASVSVSYHGHNLASLTLTGSLTGPGPVVLRAKVCIELLFFDVCFSHTFELGAATPPPLPTAPDLLDALHAELTDPSRLRPAGAPDPSVRLAPVEPQLTTPVVAPTGSLVWEQQRAPLDLLLTRVGGTPLPAPAQVHATSTISSDAATDWFAPGQFLDLSDDQALTRPGYELLSSGLRLAGAGSSDGPGTQTTLTTRQIRLPAAAQVTRPPLVFPSWILTTTPPVATPAIVVRVESWVLTTPVGEQINLTGAQARQLAAASAGGRAIPESDRLAALSF